MSQAKVDARKEYKKNREKYEKAEKRKSFLRWSVVALIVVLIGCWAGYSAYVSHEENKEAVTTSVDYGALDDYTSSLSTENVE